MSLEEIGTRRQVLSDVATKEERIRQFLERNGIDALVLGRQDNFAWVTTGGDSGVVSTTEMGVGTVVIGKDRKWLVSYAMDGRRLVEEQMAGEGYELVTLYWHEGDPATRILELTEGMEIGADVPLSGARQYGPEIVDLHTLSPISRLRATAGLARGSTRFSPRSPGSWSRVPPGGTWQRSYCTSTRGLACRSTC